MPDIVPASSGDATPAPAATAPATPAPATATPAPAVSTQPAVQSTGEPPQERWPDILDNARKKTRAEVEQEFRNKYGHYDIFERDPWGAVQNWLENASQHSVYGPMVHQWAQQYVTPPVVGEEPQADVPIVDQNGHVTGQTFSDKQLRAWHQWNQKQQQQQLDERFGALERSTREREQRDQAAQAWQQATQHATTQLTQLRAMPYFQEHEPAIRQALLEHDEWGDNVHAAYVHVLINTILPALGLAEQQKVITSLSNKSTGASVSPTSASAGQPRFKSFRDAAEYFAAHPDEAKTMAETSR